MNSGICTKKNSLRSQGSCSAASYIQTKFEISFQSAVGEDFIYEGMMKFTAAFKESRNIFLWWTKAIDKQNTNQLHLRCCQIVAQKEELKKTYSFICLTKNCRVVTLFLYIIIIISLIVYLLWIMYSVCINNMTVCSTTLMRKTWNRDKWKQKRLWLLRTIKHYTASQQGAALGWFNGVDVMFWCTFWGCCLAYSGIPIRSSAGTLLS